MARLYFSSRNQDLFLLGRLFHSIFCRRYKAAGRSRLDFLREEVQERESLKRVAAPSRGRMGNPDEKEEKVRSVEISHPWPGWVELMDHLLKKGYLDRGTFQSSSSSCSSSKDLNQIRTACLNFARENSKLIREFQECSDDGDDDDDGDEVDDGDDDDDGDNEASQWCQERRLHPS